MRFSQSTLGWYPENIKYQDLPDDIVTVPDALYEALRNKPIEVGPDGQPRELVPAGPTQADLVFRALSELRSERQPIMQILDGLQASALATGNQPEAAAIEQVKQGLRDITMIDLWACATYDDMRLAAKAAYAQIVAQASPSVRAAFKEALS